MLVLGRRGPDQPAPASIVTGAAWVRGLARPTEPSRLVVEEVTFAPSSYTVWHAHPFGQLIIVTAGNGWLQSRGQPAVAISTGDAVWIEPGEEHWHGSTPETVLTHLTVQEHDGGKEAVIGGNLSDDSYPPMTRHRADTEGPAT